MTLPFAIGPIVHGVLGRPDVISVRREAPGSWSESTGTWTSGSVSTISMSAIVQPAQPREVEALPEAERAKDAIRVFTITALQISSIDGSVRSDRLTWNNRTYEVVKLEDREDQAGYFKAIATLVGLG